MVTTNDLDTGMAVYVDDKLYLVLNYEHTKQARGGAFVRVTLKNMKTGEVHKKRYKSGDNFQQAYMEEKNGQFLYDNGQFYVFMDMENYDQIELTEDILGDKIKYFRENMELSIQYCDGEPIGIILPRQVTLEVEETDPGLKGDTAQGGTKPAKMSSGLVVNVPLFINEGEKIIVNTDKGEYVGRAEE